MSLAILSQEAFEHVNQDADAPGHELYLRQTGTRHIMISIGPEDNVIDAVYDAGRRDQATVMRGHHEAWLKSMRILEPLTPLIKKP